MTNCAAIYVVFFNANLLNDLCSNEVTVPWKLLFLLELVVWNEFLNKIKTVFIISNFRHNLIEFPSPELSGISKIPPPQTFFARDSLSALSDQLDISTNFLQFTLILGINIMTIMKIMKIMKMNKIMKNILIMKNMKIMKIMKMMMIINKKPVWMHIAAVEILS